MIARICDYTQMLLPMRYDTIIFLQCTRVYVIFFIIKTQQPGRNFLYSINNIESFN